MDSRLPISSWRRAGSGWSLSCGASAVKIGISGSAAGAAGRCARRLPAAFLAVLGLWPFDVARRVVWVVFSAIAASLLIHFWNRFMLLAGRGFGRRRGCSLCLRFGRPPRAAGLGRRWAGGRLRWRAGWVLPVGAAAGPRAPVERVAQALLVIGTGRGLGHVLAQAPLGGEFAGRFVGGVLRHEFKLGAHLVQIGHTRIAQVVQVQRGVLRTQQ